MEESRMDPERMNTVARALGDAFFAKENARLLAELRAEARKAKEHDGIRAMGLDRARHVAEDAGGLLGLTSKISASEQAALDERARLLAG
jgi:hypothetical protein